LFVDCIVCGGIIQLVCLACMIFFMKNNKLFNILVIGELCIDKFTYGKSFRLCPDVPAPVFTPIDEICNAGMAGNVVTNLSHSKIHVELVTNSEIMIKQRYVDKLTNHTFLRVDLNDSVKPYDNYSPAIEEQLDTFDVVIISDYCKGFVTEELIEKICNNHPLVILETKKVLGEYCKNAQFVKMNEKEFEDIKDKIDINEWKDKLIITLGDRGCMYQDKIYPVHKVEVFDLCGAGDTFLAAFAIGYCVDRDVYSAIEHANQAASDVVQHRGVVSCYSRTGDNGEEITVKKLNM